MVQFEWVTATLLFPLRYFMRKPITRPRKKNDNLAKFTQQPIHGNCGHHNMHLANLKGVLKSGIWNELQVTMQPRVHSQSERQKTWWSVMVNESWNYRLLLWTFMTIWTGLKIWITWSCPSTPGKWQKHCKNELLEQMILFFLLKNFLNPS